MDADATDGPDPNRPFDGPEWRVSRTLRDGTEVTLRPVMPEDREEMRRGILELSPDSRYLRFFAGMGAPSEQMLDYLTRVDQDHHVAICATLTSPDLKTERGIGVARFVRLEGAPEIAEGAITVVDDMQGKGLGQCLAIELGRAAALRGVRVLRAEVLATNTKMREILEGAGAVAVADRDDDPDTVSYDLALPPPDQEDALARHERSMVEILRGAAETMAMTIRRLLPPALRPDGDDATR
ncbi:MAG: GNAT family N-acetyltransferase [Polyangiaceae bacterium]